jgi:hypothetical protein
MLHQPTWSAHAPAASETNAGGARVLRPRVLTEVGAQAPQPTQVPPRPTQVPPRPTRVPPRPHAGCRQARLETASTLQRPSTPHTQGAESASSINVAPKKGGLPLRRVPALERNHPLERNRPFAGKLSTVWCTTPTAPHSQADPARTISEVVLDRWSAGSSASHRVRTVRMLR